ncbi:Atp-citrate synthase beta chain protein [Thalictrum thalictroides]|uniref:Atp-citrate synthase beta chain protein n=1 Tax=Thalictrum thalictroides TaxID=46969 RepID=A0A7J6WKM1_THATH|nr:Atp-citrate synthase beta chain protein [Thalictrum thalictroides]
MNMYFIQLEQCDSIVKTGLISASVHHGYGTALFYNYKQLPIQRMLDFDFLCGREKPSVAGIINPGAEGFQNLFFGQEEIPIPVHSA